MPRLCYDSTTATDLPRRARLVLAYIDGAYKNRRQVRAWCRRARIATVTVLGDIAADIADCETGDLNPHSAAAWAKKKIAHKAGHPTIYYPLSWHNAVVAAIRAEGLRPGRDVSLFPARYNGKTTIPAGCVAVQFANPTYSHHHYDVSAVAAYWPGVDPRPRRLRGSQHLPTKPIPTPAPPTQGENMKTLTSLLRSAAVWVKTHPRKVRHEITVAVTALAAQPAVHTVLAGKSAAVVIAAVTGAALWVAARVSKA